MKFAKRGDRNTIYQKFNPKTICFKKAGTTYNNFEFIQAANVDTDIKEVIKKYNCSVDEAAEFMKKKGGMQGIYGEFQELQAQCQSLADIIQLKDKADKMFYNLPTEIRDKYGNNLEQFFKDLTTKKEEPVKEPEQTKPEETK